MEAVHEDKENCCDEFRGKEELGYELRSEGDSLWQV